MREQKITPELTKAIEKYHSLAVDLSDDLYAHPELPLQEFRSSRKVVDILREAGYEVEYPYLGYTSFLEGSTHSKKDYVGEEWPLPGWCG